METCLCFPRKLLRLALPGGPAGSVQGSAPRAGRGAPTLRQPLRRKASWSQSASATAPGPPWGAPTSVPEPRVGLGHRGHGSATRDGLAQLSALPLVPSLSSGKTWGEVPGLGHAKVQHILPDGSWEGQHGPKDRHPPHVDLRTRMTQIIWLLLPTPWNHCSLAPVCSSDAPNLSPPQGLCTGYSPSWHTHTRTPYCLGRLLPVI